MKRNRSRVCKVLISTGLLFYLTFGITGISKGYIMPAEQLLDLMSRNFSKLNSLVIKHSTLHVDQDGEKVFEEMVQLKSPKYSRAESTASDTGRMEEPDMTYRFLMMSNKVSFLQDLLAVMGINPWRVTYTRIDGIIAYRIGDEGQGGGELLIEKERFLPLMLVYPAPAGQSGELITIRFRDYRKPGETWYPFEIEYSAGKKIREIYTIISFQPNVPVDDTFIRPIETKKPEPPAAPKVEEAPDIEEERLRKIIKAFEEKFR